MIAEYIHIQGEMRERASYVGRLLISYKHYASRYPIGVATPWVADLDNDNVAIVVGLTADKQTGTIAVPVSLFESGTEGAIKTWITQQNIEHQKSANDVSGKEPDTGREREIQILHELLSRYPEEAVHHE